MGSSVITSQNAVELHKLISDIVEDVASFSEGITIKESDEKR